LDRRASERVKEKSVDRIDTRGHVDWIDEPVEAWSSRYIKLKRKLTKCRSAIEAQECSDKYELSSDPFYLTIVSKSNIVDNKY